MNMESNLFSGLNKEQNEAVTTTQGYVRVIAGPGSGKTKTLVSRYCHLVENCGVSPLNILCITFTNKAADVMKKRLTKIFGANFFGYVKTIHSFCAQILREEISRITFPKTFNILDEEELDNIYKELFEKFSLKESGITYKDVSQIIYIYKKHHINEYIEYLINPLNAALNDNDFIKDFLDLQRKNYCLDFNDLIFFVLYIFDKFPDVLHKYQNQFQYLMIDEFQDITNSEFLIAHLISDKHKNFFVVGDPNQKIFSWRGSQNYISDFPNEYPSCKTIVLNTNYRSSPEILKISNSLIKHNPQSIEINMRATNPASVLPTVYNSSNRNTEALWIALKIKELESQGTCLSDVAILYRSNRNSRVVEQGLLSENVPYKIYGNVGFYKRKEVVDLITYLRFIINYDDISFKRIINVPSRSFGKKRIQFLESKQNENGKSLYENARLFQNEKPLAESKLKDFINLIDFAEKMKDQTVFDILSYIYKESKYEKELQTKSADERIENVNELLISAKALENDSGKLSLAEYLDRITLYSKTDEDEEKDKVRLMTIHNSKGQEFKNVFVFGLNESIFPSSKAESPNEIEEERRLAYVAFTRAKNKLFLTCTTGYDNQKLIPSRFLFEFSKEDVVWEGVKLPNNQINNEANQPENPNIPNLLSKGSLEQRIQDPSSGIGSIVSVNDDKTNPLQNPDKNINSLEQSLDEEGIFLTVNEIIKEYGFSRYKIMQLIHSEEIPASKKGNKYIISKAKLDEYLEEIRKKRNSELITVLIILFLMFLIPLILCSIYIKTIS